MCACKNKTNAIPQQVNSLPSGSPTIVSKIENASMSQVASRIVKRKAARVVRNGGRARSFKR
jgi:hypothetical protein